MPTLGEVDLRTISVRPLLYDGVPRKALADINVQWTHDAARDKYRSGKQQEEEMRTWTDRRILDLLGVEILIIQAPMAGATSFEMVVATARAGGLGSLPSAQYNVAQLREALTAIREATDAPINVNFFAHSTPADDPAALKRWQALLAPYYLEHGLDPPVPSTGAGRAPFDSSFCEVVENSALAWSAFISACQSGVSWRG
ncbi:hypothetical protein CUJ84_Chr002258 [Rhizobium leguminosarum]|uniref:Uncharacterized protein n=1 Tax=Rhizobium leguminosarum TaxID=384 RepID=A0A2K9Z2Y0_RHILE|nr:hypothetical protein CUJ84_Chr002258 [Rhizobium leguminosarum]